MLSHSLDARAPVRTFLRRGISLLLLLSMSQVTAAMANAQDVYDIDEMCMLSERIMNDYALVGMRVVYGDPRADLQASKTQIEKYLSELKQRDFKAALSAELKTLDQTWSRIGAQIGASPNQDTAVALRQQIDDFTNLCEKLAEEIARDTGDKKEFYIEQIAELGKDIEQLASMYVMKAWGVPRSNYDQVANDILTNFEKITAEIESAPADLVTDAVKQSMQKIEQDFQLFKFMATSKSGRFIPQLAQKKSASIYDEIHQILAAK